MRAADDDTPSLPEDAAALRALLLETLAQVGTLVAERDALASQNERLRHLLLKLKRRQFGTKSERLPEEQLLFAFEEIEATLAGNAAEAGKASPTLRDNQAKRRQAGRGRLPAHLPRIEVVLAPEATACPCCQGPLVEIGTDAAERLDVIPAQFRVVVTKRPKLACRACPGVVLQEPAPARLIEGGMPTEATVAHVLVSRYADHLPLYRQSHILARQGIEIGREVLADWAGAGAMEFVPVVRRMREILLGSARLFADETTILSAKSRVAVTSVEGIMSLRSEPIGEIPVETLRVAQAAFPRGTVVMRLRDEFHDVYRNEDFRDFYPRKGQPALAPWRLALVTVLQFLENLSDRQTAEAVRARIDWKYALGLELTDPGFHFSVLTEFRARLVAGKAEHLLLDRMLERFKARGLVRARGKQRTDSTHVLAAVHDLHLLELVAETLRATLDDLAAVASDWLRGIAQPVWFKRYARRIEDYHLPKSQERREALAREIGADGFLLLDALNAPGAPAAAREAPMVGTLHNVWRVHYARDGGKPRLRAGTELPPVGERVQSPHDTDAHYSMKRQIAWLGYKVHVTETCDEGTAHVITHVATCPAMQPDMASTAAIQRQLARKDLLPAEHFVDSGYVDAGLLASSWRDHGISLEGPVRGVSTSQSRLGRGYEQKDFAIDWEHEHVTCPQGKTSAMWRMTRDEDGSPRIQAVFSQHDCRPCAARAFCAPGKGARRFIYFHPRSEYEALHAARARMNDPAWQERYHIRAGVEGTISQGVRAFAMRRSRYIGLAKTGLQQICVAAGMNVLRVVNWLDGQPRAKTRVTRFASLAQAA